jgi:hypothetical protein
MKKHLSGLTDKEKYLRFKFIHSIAYGRFLRKNPFIIRDFVPSYFVDEYDTLLEVLK